MPTSTREPADGSTLSVVLPNYNHGRFIGRAIDALLSQERLPDEIIIVDDGSTDDSFEIIQRHSAKSSLITVLRQPVNMGTVAAMQRGLECAKGHYVALAAADDWVLPGFLRLGLQMLTLHRDVGLFCGDIVLLDQDTGRLLGYRPPVRPMYRAGAFGPSETRQLLARADNFIHTSGAVFRRDALLAAGGFDVRLGAFADGYLTRKIALTSGFCYAPHAVACWHVFASSVSHTTALTPEKALHALELYPACLASDSAFPAWYPELFRDRWRFSTARLALQTNDPDFDFINRMTATSQVDRLVLRAIEATCRGSLMRVAMLGWLWLRLRPYRLTDLIATALVRKLEKLTRGNAAF